MRSAPFLVALVVASLSLPGQDYLHYKFVSGCGTDVINFAEGATAGPAKMVSTQPGAPATSWTTGKWDNGMTGSNSTGQNYVDCGWNAGTYTGSFSISMWIRNNKGNPSAIPFGYLFGATGSSFRCFTGSSGKLFVGGWGGSPGNLVNASDLTTLLNAGYVHVALVVDQSAAKATYYINGTADPAISLTGSVSFTASNFSVGKYSTSTGSPMDFDEFLFTKRVLSASDVKVLAASLQAGAGKFGTGNPATLQPGGGRPYLGNASFQLTLQDSQAQAFLLYIGSGRCKIFSSVNLPVDLGTLIPAFAGVNAYTDIDLFTFSAGLSGGTATIPVPVPNLAPLAGFTTYWQAYTITANNALRGANAVAVSPGF